MTVLFFIIGTCLASFFTCIANEQTINFTRRSQCDNCRHALEAIDLMPLVSFLILKGACRHCHTSLNRNYFFLELLGGCFGLSLYYLQFNSFYEGYLLSLIICWLLLLSIEDCFHLQVNWWGLFILGVLCLFNRQSLWVAVVIWLLLETIIYYRPKAFGGADAKIIGLLACTLEEMTIPYFILGAALFGLLYSILQYQHTKRWNAIPFIPSIAISYLFCLFL